MGKLLLAVRHPHFLPIYPQASGKLYVSTNLSENKKAITNTSTEQNSDSRAIENLGFVWPENSLW